jgi:hypothetical protein
LEPKSFLPLVTGAAHLPHVEQQLAGSPGTLLVGKLSGAVNQ